ncbi:MAG: HAD family hydrolase [Acidimicrobiales bacterium]
MNAVFFDGDQTLWDFDAVMRRSIGETLEELRKHRPGRVPDDLAVEALVVDRDVAAGAFAPGEADMVRIRRAGFARTLRRIGLEDDGLADHLTDFYLEHRFTGVLPYPDVLPCLRALSATFALGLLSNGNSYPERCGLDGVFEVVVFAQDHGFAKPDRRLFDAASARIANTPDALFMVGDSMAKDVAGAQGAGWRGIWLNRDHAARPDGPEPDATITSLSELPEALGVLVAQG